MNRDPNLPSLKGASRHQVTQARRLAVASGLNLPRAQALFLANRRRNLRPGEQAELDQILARFDEADRTVKASSPPAATQQQLARFAQQILAQEHRSQITGLYEHRSNV